MFTVAVGMPVLNGAPAIRDALDCIVNQTHRDLEIVISDNDSTDETAAICREYADRDPRIRYFRQPKRLSSIENFRFCLEQTSAPWFMWAAHDDTRSENYIETLARGAQRHSSAALIFTDVGVISEPEARATRRCSSMLRPPELPELLPGMTAVEKHKLLAKSPWFGLQVYGLHSRETLRTVPWSNPFWGNDHTFLHHLAAIGCFHYEPGATFFYDACVEDHRRRTVAYLSIKAIGWVSLSTASMWNAAGVSVNARYPKGLEVHRAARRAELFLSMGTAAYGSLAGWAQALLYELAPDNVKQLWHVYRRTVVRP